ncbi:3-oxoacyl-[acyl-carrier-protein] synthase III C-terminal domain-containing protein [Pedosphaera parvula]|uniref:Chalcone and stilbene synthase domain protein n=1 Tax=Pedosphaera parvula (strain Ellin514) TaxID=320771 RepID=B9XQ88_PEDPL|nr:3-oxoacyl-[acyl-carrier-protein] synthase III C-terminal domain-containing protein [Pedosphaera parvula]EEF58006.1 chalcone and stilbene synthase domain protein [Pedosphaera parvula Ellin514]
MFITGIGTAAPRQRYKQSEGWETVQQTVQFTQLTSRSKAILRKVLTGNNGVETRHLALSSLHEAFEINPDILHQRFARHAPQLAAEAAEEALKNSQTDRREIDAVIISTCTGYICPGLTSYVSEKLGLKPDVFALDLVGQGCGAALPNMRAGEALLASGRSRRVLSICVEVCSAAMFIDDDPGVLISACLFGDGSGAAVLSNEPNPNNRRIEWKVCNTMLAAKDREFLRFEMVHGMLRNVLRPEVPMLAAENADKLLRETLARAGVTRGEIKNWIWHAGGRDVLLALQEKLGLSTMDTRWSAEVLREYGNMSSPCVYFALQNALAEQAGGGVWWMCSFGAGFSCHGALLEVS